MVCTPVVFHALPGPRACDHVRVKEAQAPEKEPPDHCLHPPKDSTHLLQPRCSDIEESHTKDAPGWGHRTDASRKPWLRNVFLFKGQEREEKSFKENKSTFQSPRGPAGMSNGKLKEVISNRYAWALEGQGVSEVPVSLP